jgi:phosphoglucosamine mutase
MKSYPQVLVNVRVSRKVPFDTIAEVKTAIDRLENELQGRGRLLVRYSGTENLARVMIEGEEQGRIEAQARELADRIRDAIGE